MANEDNLKSWKKGESGNIKGRPKGRLNRSTIARKWLEMAIQKNNPLTNELENLTQEDLITLAQIKKAIDEGDTQSYKALMDSGYGSVIQQSDLNVNVDKGNLPDWLNDEGES